ncbi:Putative E3 ubiquitin-protein ligase complex, subunit SLX5/Rfp1 [Septoria linicola]|uniref:E3 ubiquitin-protein ligase complex, subunit SLX5/Rfp1 n=1 Tax=Septoria linicola TaxID=215465 RepID=A0A9Q9EHT7_9PEZI|nr:putative E3 ubiquitin-protein ligase complex, subunit SLX5/Rfp1 [Septoria linicola]USW49638.1 Putative E3 ubiquitin-protein ligase complex, subunit SLX5/Rfp1 [Septoria linicola]
MASGSSGYPLLRRESTKRTFSRMNAGQRSTSPDTLFVAQDDHYDNEHASRRPRGASRLALPPPPLHFPGDGLDYRRPVMSRDGSGSNSSSTRRPGAAAGVIDLTEEEDSHENGGHMTSASEHTGTAGASRAQRGPRFGRNIIDLESEAEDEAHTRTNSHAPALPATRPNWLTLFPTRQPSTTNPHPRFSGLRRPDRISPARRAEMDDSAGRRSRHNRLNGESTRGHRSVTPYPNGATEPIDLTGEDDDVVFLEMRAGVNAARPETTAGSGTRSMLDRVNDLREMAGDGRLFGRLWGLGAASNTNARDEGIAMGGPRGQIRFAAPMPGFMPVTMGYDAPAFDLGLGGNDSAEKSYDPPPAASEGFTRSPGEDEIVVCPNCGDELAVSENEKKAEVWIIKKCGHAYCGNCVQLRTKAARGKGKAPAHSMPMPFKECVVHGCKEKAGPKAMLHVYVGS